MGKKIVSIENFNQDSNFVKLNSPRSVEACKRQGIVPEELTKVSRDQIEQEVREATKAKLGSPQKIPGHVARNNDDYTR